ncbi:MAG: NAD(P)H-dependent oxidoreductase [Geminicoccaceae bacterium]
MRILVVYAHPVETSFSAAVHQKVIEKLRERGHEVRDLDLYAEGFDPVLSRAERVAYEIDGDHRKAIEAHVERIKWAEGLVFVYPTWWYGLPAIMKGWLERIWLPGITFELPQDQGPIKPLMQHIRLLGGISTYGATWWLTRWVGDPGRRTLMRGLRALCAKRCRTFWLAHYDMDRSTAATRASFLKRIDRRLDQL